MRERPPVDQPVELLTESMGVDLRKVRFGIKLSPAREGGEGALMSPRGGLSLSRARSLSLSLSLSLSRSLSLSLSRSLSLAISLSLSRTLSLSLFLSLSRFFLSLHLFPFLTCPPQEHSVT